MSSPCDNQLTNLKLVSHPLDITIPHVSQNGLWYQEFCGYCITISFCDIMQKYVFACMTGTYSKHEVCGFMNECEHLRRFSIPTVYEHVWSHTIYKSKSATFINVQDTMRVVANNTIKCNKNSSLLQTFCHHANGCINRSDAKSPSCI